MKKNWSLLIGLLLLAIATTMAQEDEDLGTETVTVVKSYTPSVSDATKLRSQPSLEDSIVQQKKVIEYSIFSVPVASTFSPAKGKASPVERSKPEKIYNTSVSAALGNYNNAQLDFYTSRDIDRGDKRVDIGLNHLSSRGDIENTPLDNDFYNTKLNATYHQKESDWNWFTKIGLQHQLYNWYGLPETITDEATINAIDERQNYYTAEISAGIDMEEGVFKGGDFFYRRFWDASESGENRFRIEPKTVFPLADAGLEISAVVDYAGGSFEKTSLNNTVNSPQIDYGQWQFGLNPNIVILRNDWALSLGANLVYGLDTENSDGNFYIYPTVNASYRLSDDLAIAYGGIVGELKQNSYYDFVDQNPFVSPTLDIQPTDEQYSGFIGLRGQLLPSLSYNLKASYSAENRRPLFILNPENAFRDDDQGYYFGNSFQVFYDDLRTIGFMAELNMFIDNSVTLGLKGEYFDYSTETDNPAWNLPEIKGSFYLDYQINDSWYFGANLFYIGEREDFASIALENSLPSEFPATLITLDSYFDINAKLGYNLNKQLSLFLKGNNLANNQYERWANFRVQGLQVLAGVSYKFDL